MNTFGIAIAKLAALVLTGTPVIAQDCDDNGIPDSVQIAGDPSLDLNSNGVLDDCENIANITQGTFWSNLQFAVDNANEDDEIVLQPGMYPGIVSIHGRGLVIRGTDPNDRQTVLATQVAMNDSIRINNTGESHDITLQGVSFSSVVLEPYEQGELIIDRCDVVTREFSAGIWYRGTGSQPLAVKVAHTTVSGPGEFVFTNASSVSESVLIMDIDQSLITSQVGFLADNGKQFQQFLVQIRSTTMKCMFAMFLPASEFSFIEISNSIIRGAVSIEVQSDRVFTNSNIQGNADQGSVIDVDPMFADPDGPDNDPLTADDNDFTLLPGSPCIDATGGVDLLDNFDIDGDGFFLEPLPLDLARNPRTFGSTPDMGAYEYQGPPPCPADLAAPFGTLNFFDVAAYIGFYNAGDPAADLAAPFGTLNFFDISAFIAAYNAGCP